MLELIRALGRGILYTILSPFYFAFFILNMLYGILVYLFMEISSVVMFFLGKSYLGDDYETTLLKEKKKLYTTPRKQSHFRSPISDQKGGDNHDL